MSYKEELYQEFLHGNPEGIKPIYTIYRKILFDYGNKLTRKKDRVEDGVLHAFSQLLEQIGTFKTAKDIHRFLYRKVRDYLREENRLIRQLDTSATGQDELADPTAQEEIDDFQLRQRVALKEAEILKALEKLPRRRREDFRNYYYDHKSIDEIALERNRSTFTVRRNIELAADEIDKHLNSKGLGKKHFRRFLFFF